MKLVPTEGGYQKEIEVKLIREGKTFFEVQDVNSHRTWKMSKSDMLRVGYLKHEFPTYKLVLDNPAEEVAANQ